MSEEEIQALDPSESDTLRELEESKNQKIDNEALRMGAGEAEPVAPADLIDPDAEEVGEKIQIGDREFATQDEAMAYARDLHASGETEKLLHDAYRQGISDAKIADPIAQGVTQPVEEEEDDFDQKFFENPKEYLKAMQEKVRQEAMDAALGKIQQDQADKQLWDEFYGKNPDLAGFEEDCQAVLAREAAMIETLVKTSGKEKAMDYLARKTRAKFQTWAERQRPKKELDSSGGGPTPTGGERVTQGGKENADGPVDFVTEMKQHRKELENRS